MKRILLLLCVVVMLFACNCTNTNEKDVQYKYSLGDVVFVKPDSLKATISARYSYENNNSGDNGIRYEIQYYDKEGNQRSDYVKEFQIFSKQF